MNEKDRREQFDATIFKDRFETATQWVDQALIFAHRLDWLGKSEQYEEGSQQRGLADLRNEVDRQFSLLYMTLSSLLRVRLKFTFSTDLLLTGSSELRGDGSEALEVIRRDYELYGDESMTLERAVQEEILRLEREGVSKEEIDQQKEEIKARASAEVGNVGSGTAIDLLAWETYARVEQLRELAKEYPKHVTHAAQRMHGWPMVVSQHVDCAPEFRSMVERLKVGAQYPLDVSARKKRGSETPMLRYLQPLVYNLDLLREWVQDPLPQDKDNVDGLIKRSWDVICGAMRVDDETRPEMVEVLRPVAGFGPLTKESAREWTTKLIVPVITLRDAKTQETCDEPALQSIWRQGGVKSPAIFRSRLNSAVYETLKTFAREGGSEGDEAGR